MTVKLTHALFFLLISSFASQIAKLGGAPPPESCFLGPCHDHWSLGGSPGRRGWCRGLRWKSGCGSGCRSSRCGPQDHHSKARFEAPCGGDTIILLPTLNSFEWWNKCVMSALLPLSLNWWKIHPYAKLGPGANACRSAPPYRYLYSRPEMSATCGYRAHFPFNSTVQLPVLFLDLL